MAIAAGLKLRRADGGGSKQIFSFASIMRAERRRAPMGDSEEAVAITTVTSTYLISCTPLISGLSDDARSSRVDNDA